MLSRQGGDGTGEVEVQAHDVKGVWPQSRRGGRRLPDLVLASTLLFHSQSFRAVTTEMHSAKDAFVSICGFNNLCSFIPIQLRW